MTISSIEKRVPRQDAVELKTLPPYFRYNLPHKNNIKERKHEQTR
jgi:hypothetical protein